MIGSEAEHVPLDHCQQSFVQFFGLTVLHAASAFMSPSVLVMEQKLELGQFCCICSWLELTSKATGSSLFTVAEPAARVKGPAASSSRRKPCGTAPVMFILMSCAFRFLVAFETCV